MTDHQQMVLIMIPALLLLIVLRYFNRRLKQKDAAESHDAAELMSPPTGEGQSLS